MERHRHHSLLVLLLATTVLAVTSDDTGKVDLPLNIAIGSLPESGRHVTLINTGKGNPALKTESTSTAESAVLEDTGDGDKEGSPVASSLNIPNSNVPPEGEAGSPDLQASAKVDGEEQREKLFFWAQSSTTSKFMLSVFSSTTPYTCALGARQAGPCTGRRRRGGRSPRFLKRPIPIDNASGHTSGFLDSSSADDTARSTVGEERASAKGFLTVWTTSFSTKTVTSWFTDTRVTVSVSQACTLAGNINFLAGCG